MNSNQTASALRVNVLPPPHSLCVPVCIYSHPKPRVCQAPTLLQRSGSSLCSFWLLAQCSDGPATSLWWRSLVVPSSELSIWKILWPPSLSFLIWQTLLNRKTQSTPKFIFPSLLLSWHNHKSRTGWHEPGCQKLNEGPWPLDHIGPASKVLISPPLPGTPTSLRNPERWLIKMLCSQQVFNKILVENKSHKCLLAHGFATTVSFEVWTPAARFLLPLLMQTVLAALFWMIFSHQLNFEAKRS